MNLLLRLFWILFQRRKQPQCGAFDTLRVRSRVFPNDLDLNMHVNNGRYLTFADLGRVDWFFFVVAPGMLLASKALFRLSVTLMRALFAS